MNASATLKDRLGLAEAAVAPDEKMRPMTPLELEWKQRIYQKLLRVLGWAITAFAVSFGAPFWFEALSRLGSLRNAGTRPDPT